MTDTPKPDHEAARAESEVMICGAGDAVKGDAALNLARCYQDLQAERDKWRAEYENLAKFANDYEAERDALRKENEDWLAIAEMAGADGAGVTRANKAACLRAALEGAIASAAERDRLLAIVKRGQAAEQEWENERDALREEVERLRRGATEESRRLHETLAYVCDLAGADVNNVLAEAGIDGDTEASDG